MQFAPARARGFTLFEMLAVIVLIGVAVGLVGIGLGRGLQGASERQALARTVDALRAARVQAIVSGQPARARFDLRQRTVQGPVRAGSQRQPQGLAQWPADWQVRLQTAEGLGAAFEFYPDGGASGGNVSISRGERHWRIDVGWLTGSVRLRELP